MTSKRNMPDFGEALTLTVQILLFCLVLSVPAFLLLLTGNVVLLLVSYLWIAFTSLFTIVYVLMGWVEEKGKPKLPQDPKLVKSYEEQYKEEIERRHREN